MLSVSGVVLLTVSALLVVDAQMLADSSLGGTFVGSGGLGPQRLHCPIPWCRRHCHLCTVAASLRSFPGLPFQLFSWALSPQAGTPCGSPLVTLKPVSSPWFLCDPWMSSGCRPLLLPLYILLFPGDMCWGVLRMLFVDAPQVALV